MAPSGCWWLAAAAHMRRGVDMHSHRITMIHTCAHHGVEGLFQLLLLQEQSTGHTLPLTVTASRGEETCQQDHQAPQRDLHRSAHPDRQRQRGAQQTEEFKTRSQQLEDLGGKSCGIWVQPAGRESGQTDRNTAWIPTRRDNLVDLAGQSKRWWWECSSNNRKWTVWVERERAQPEAINDKMGNFQWTGIILCRLEGWIADRNHTPQAGD